MSQKVTLKDISEKLGVSMITVSRALRGVGRINPETQRKILQTAEMMGYRRHNGSLSGSFGRGYPEDHTLRILLPLFRPCSNPLGGRLGERAIQRIKEGVEAMGGTLTVIEVDDLDDLKQQLPRARVQGIVLRQVLPVQWLQGILMIAPVVYAISHDVQPHIDAVYFNEFKASTLIFDALVSRGHKSIAWISWDRANPMSRVKEDCFDINSAYDRQAMNFTRSRMGSQRVLDLGLRAGDVRHEHILLELPELESHADIDYELAAKQAAEAILALKERPTAVVIPFDQTAELTMKHLREAGIQVPREMSVATYLLPETSEFISGKISGIRLPFSKIGAMVPEIIQRRVANPEAPYISVLVEAELLDRGTIAKAP